MDEIYLIDPCIGTRRLVKVLERDHDRKVNGKRLRRLRREMGLETIGRRPRHTSAPDKGEPKVSKNVRYSVFTHKHRGVFAAGW